MAGSMGDARPESHPDHDLLADLAAEVLPDDLAARVQGHVEGCPSCAALLAEAEGIRSLLRQGEPEPMPDDVLVRIEAALVLARTEARTEARPEARTEVPTRAQTQEQPTPVTPAAGAAAIANPAAAVPDRDRSRRIVRRLPTGAAAGTTGASRLGRMNRPALRARRQALDEQRADRPSVLARAWPALRVAAGVVLVLGVGGLALQAVQNGGGQASDSTASGAGSAASAPILATVESTGTNYQRVDLKQQVKALITVSDQAGAGMPTEAQKSLSDAATTSAPVAPAPTGSRNRLGSSGTLLRDPAALRACLAELGAGDAQPVAVDLARYAGRDAAIIVLNAAGGGYDVWVVARDCRPAADGTIAFVSLSP